MSLREPVNLIFMLPGNPQGGCISYTVHLYRGLEQLGYEPRIIRTSARTQDKLTPFAGGLLQQRMSVEDAVKATRSAPTIICYAFWKDSADDICRLVGAGATYTVHALVELTQGAIDLHKRLGRPLVAIREELCAPLRKEGVDARYGRHPFIPAGVEHQKGIRAIAATRVDFCKHTEIVAEANLNYLLDEPIVIYGEENRMFTHHTLDKKHPGWRQNYRGKYINGTAPQLIGAAEKAIDLTAWSVAKGDGGGSQYAFLEAWDAGCILVINSQWVERHPKADLQPGSNCLAIADARELADAVRAPVDQGMIRAGRDMLASHAPHKTIPPLMDVACR